MSNVEFEEENNNNSILYNRFERSDKKPGMVAWLIRKNFAKSESEANYMLLIITFFCILAALYFFLHSTKKSNPIIYKEDISPTDREILPPDTIKSLPSKR